MDSFLEKKNAQTRKVSFETIIMAEEKTSLFETDDGKEFIHKIFINLLNTNNKIDFLDLHSYELLLQKELSEMLEISSKNLFVKKVMLIGSMYCQNNETQ